MTFVKQGVVLPRHTAGGGLEYSIRPHSVIPVNDKYYMYYSAQNVSGTWGMLLAISEDGGFTFIKQGVCVVAGGGTSMDDSGVLAPSVVRKNGKFYCYYSGNDGAHYRICLAISEDGLFFTKQGVVLPLGGAGTMDDAHVLYGGAALHNGKVFMFYAGHDGSYYRGCLAISEDMLNFEKQGVCVTRGLATQVDDAGIFHGGSPLRSDGKWYVYYGGSDGTHRRICLAIVQDDLTVTKQGVVIPLGGAGTVDDYHTMSPAPIKINDKVFVYYAGNDATYTNGCLAISQDTM